VSWSQYNICYTELPCGHSCGSYHSVVAQWAIPVLLSWQMMWLQWVGWCDNLSD